VQKFPVTVNALPVTKEPCGNTFSQTNRSICLAHEAQLDFASYLQGPRLTPIKSVMDVIAKPPYSLGIHCLCYVTWHDHIDLTLIRDFCSFTYRFWQLSYANGNQNILIITCTVKSTEHGLCRPILPRPEPSSALINCHYLFSITIDIPLSIRVQPLSPARSLL
jgi:hypothetical protein